jgi:hypothetical protein
LLILAGLILGSCAVFAQAARVQRCELSTGFDVPVPAGKDVYLRLMPGAAVQDGMTLRITGLRLKGLVDQRGATIGCTANGATYREIVFEDCSFEDFSMSAAAVAAKFHDDGVKFDQAGAKPTDITFRRCTWARLGSGVTPVHAVDGVGAYGTITFDQCVMTDCAHPMTIGGKQATVKSIVLRDSPTVRVAAGGPGAIPVPVRIATTQPAIQPATVPQSKYDADMKAANQAMADLKAKLAELAK